MNKVNIGKIVNAVGLKGEVKVYSFAEKKESYEALPRIYLGEGRFQEYKIENVRYNKELVILKLAGVDDRNGAESLKGTDLFIGEEDLPALPEDAYYVRDLIGIRVEEEGRGLLGTLCDVVKNSAQDLYEVELENKKKILIPGVEEFVLEINMKERLMKVRLIEGFLE